MPVSLSVIGMRGLTRGHRRFNGIAHPCRGEGGTKFPAVDEKRWRVLDPKGNAALLIRRNAIGHCLAFEVAAELRKI